MAELPFPPPAWLMRQAEIASAWQARKAASRVEVVEAMDVLANRTGLSHRAILNLSDLELVARAARYA